MRSQAKFRKIIYCVGIVLVAAAICVLMAHWKVESQKIRDYPCAPGEIFAAATKENPQGEPMYIQGQIVGVVENQIQVDTQGGTLNLVVDEEGGFHMNGMPEVSSETVNVFFVYMGWDDTLGLPWGYYLGTMTEQEQGADLADYNEVRGYYESELYYAEHGGAANVTPMPVPT